MARAMARSMAAGIAAFLVLVMAGFTAEIEARLRVFFVVLPVRNRNHQERTKRKTTGRTPNERKEERGPALWLGCLSWGWLGLVRARLPANPNSASPKSEAREERGNWQMRQGKGGQPDSCFVLRSQDLVFGSFIIIIFDLD